MRAQLPLALLLVTTAVACVDDNADDMAAVAADIEKDTGGFDTADEAPVFAAEATFDAAEIEADTSNTDEMTSDPTILQMESTVGVEARGVLVMWGRFPADPGATERRDWSGELRLSRGGMIVKRRIAFEDATDRVLPRTSRDAVSFESRTRPAADGLALRVVDPTPDAAEALTLTYTATAGGASYTLDLRALASGPLVIDVGGGNRIVAVGQRRSDSCDHGFMRGRWHKLSANTGRYLGVVANEEGQVVGHVRGIYGQRRNGEPVMFGKFINRDGQFVGILKGSYEAGNFHARWLDRAGDHGTIHGLYFEGPNARGGGFLARWAETSCSEDPAQP